MGEHLAAAFEGAGFEVDFEETRLVVLRRDGTPVIELDWTACDLQPGDLDPIGQAFLSAASA